MTGLITDPDFNPSRIEEYKLSIQVSLDGFSFSVINESLNKLHVLGNSPIELSSDKFLGRRLKEWIQSNETLQNKFKKVKIIFHPENLTFVPSEYTNPGDMETLGTLVLGNSEYNQFTDNYLEYATGNLIFPVPQNLSEELEKLFPGEKLLHPLMILDNELQKLTSFKENSMTLYFSKKNFSLSLYSKSQLKAANCFKYTNSGDVIYYVLTIVKKLKLLPEKTTLFMAGDVMPKGELHENLKKFFNRVIFFTPDIHYNSQLFKEPMHRNIVLF